MEGIDTFTSLIKAFLYFALIFVLLGDIYQPIGPMARFIIISLALIEAITLNRKVDNRKQNRER